MSATRAPTPNFHVNENKPGSEREPKAAAANNMAPHPSTLRAPFVPNLLISLVGHITAAALSGRAGINQRNKIVAAAAPKKLRNDKTKVAQR